ncbi:endospore germination permease [Brevibacillus agri]|uniref:GerAB/ArcD/ProY family transporter n=1 Tax=Brevibacillus agri TaxID=51101 RepID=UPI00046F0669|nr:endospore germination permease [Brevibacillus agri]MDR9505818.1 endospore germination permease [Brevibacillus agri]
MLENYKISPRQFMMLVTLVTIGDSVLVLPAIAAELAKQDAWISVTVGLLIGLGNVLLMIAVGKCYPNESFFSFIDNMFGRVLGTVITLSFVWYTFFSAAAHVLETGDFVGTYLLNDTPSIAIQLLLVSLIMFGVRLGLQTVADSAQIYFYGFFCFFVLLMLCLIPQADVARLQPVLENGWKPVLAGAIPSIAFPFSELVIFLAILPYVSPIQRRMRYFLKGAFLGGLVLILVILMCILVLGADMTARHGYPSYVLAKQMKIGLFIQRLEAILAVVWFIAVNVKIMIYSVFFQLGLRHVFRIREMSVLTLPYMVMLLVMANIFTPNMVVYVHIISQYWPFYDFTYSIALLLLLLIVHKLRSKYGDRKRSPS